MILSIITCTFNKVELSKDYLASLEENPPPIPWELIWIDDCSTDGTREWLTSLNPTKHRVILNKANQGYAKNNNLGASIAKGEILALLNNDLILSKDWCSPMLGLAFNAPNAACIGNVQHEVLNGKAHHTGIYYYPRGKPTHNRLLPTSSTEGLNCLALTGACLLIKKSIFERLGGFDERFINGSEDIDLCLKAFFSGHNNFVALNSVIRHHVSASPGRSLHNQRNAFLLMKKWKCHIPDLAAQGWQTVSLRTHWEHKLEGWPWLAAKLLRPWLRQPTQKCPAWMIHAVEKSVARQLARWEQQFGSLTG